NQLWINLFNDTDNQSNIEKILNVALRDEVFLTPQVAIIIDELIQNGKEDTISILFPYIIKPSNEVLPIIQRWFTQYDDNRPIKKLSVLLLAEAKHIFTSAVDIIVGLLKSDNDQMRYRAERIFQHPERDVKQPKHPPRILAYIHSFFYDLLWDDPRVFRHLYENTNQLRERNSINERKIQFLNRIHFINDHTWHSIMQTLETSINPSSVIALLYSTITLTQHSQITHDNWIELARILSIIDTSQLKDKLFFIHIDTERIEFIIDNICALTEVCDETYFEILESKLISEISVNIESLSQNTYDEIKHIGRCNFYVSNDLNETILDMFNNISINIVLMENLIRWLLNKMKSFKDLDDTWFSLMICDNLLCLVSVCVQKEDYLYRKITNSSNFNKIEMITLLEKMLNYHPCFTARGNAFILLAGMDQPDHKVIVNAMNTLLDENVVKKYSIIGMPLIHLSSNEFIDDLLESLKNDSAIKTYEILKIFTEFVLNEKLDANGKSKIINYLANEIGQLKSKKPVNYYYTDIKIPFTTTLENELYKAWIKVQGLSGKTQYSINIQAKK
ncbi:unnamed protein product, partial [Rotaria sordida]